MTPESAGWGHVGFELYRLKPGQRLSAETGGREACLVLVGGKARVRVDGQDFGEIGLRMSPFEGQKPFAVYVARHGRYEVGPTTGLALGICSAPGGGDHAARLIGPDQVACSVRGTHPCGTAHGYELHYLNVMAGPKRIWRFTTEACHRWLLAS